MDSRGGGEDRGAAGIAEAPPDSSSAKLQALLEMGDSFIDLVCSGCYDPNQDAKIQVETLLRKRRERNGGLRRFRRDSSPLTSPPPLRRGSSNESEGEAQSDLGSAIANEEDSCSFKSKSDETLLLTAPPSLLQQPPKPHQLEGLRWLAQLHSRGLSGILADEMGLGKTFQSIGLLALLKERGVSGPHLVLAPKSIVGNWMQELARFCPALKAVKVLGTRATRRALLFELIANFSGGSDSSQQHQSTTEWLRDEGDKEEKETGEGGEAEQEEDAEAKELRTSLALIRSGGVSVVVTSYEMLLLESKLFNRINFYYVVVDEAHRLKNDSSKLTAAVRSCRTKFRLLLTGTPLQNNLHELWALLNLLLPSLFDSSDDFAALFDFASASPAGEAATNEEIDTVNLQIAARIHRILRPFMLRRVKRDVLKEMPPKKELVCYVPLSEMQRSLYRDLLSKNGLALQSDGASRGQLANLVVQLRKACNHPYLFDGYEPPDADPFGEHVINNSGKLRFCDRLLKRLISSQSRVLLFTQMKRMLDILEDYCRIRGFKYCRLDGATTGEDRDKQIQEFNEPNSDISIFLLSTRAGGLGLNLATADTVILYDSDWNPQVDLQATDRVHRIGQRKAVNVYRLVHEHTIEEKILQRASLKLQLDVAVLQHSRLAAAAKQQSTQLSKNELLHAVQFGAERIFKSSADKEITEEELDAILARGEDCSQKMEQLMQQHVRRCLLDFSFSSASSLYECDDITYDANRKKADREAWREAMLEQQKNEQPGEPRRRGRGAAKEEEETNVQPSSSRRLPRLPPMQDWQFFNRERILQLQACEAERPLTLEEKEEKQRLLKEGFANWSRRDLSAFIRGSEVYGRTDLSRIALEVRSKTEEEVKAYASVFWQRFKEIADWQKIVRRIEEGEAVIQRRRELEQVIVRRQQQSAFPWVSLPLSNSTLQAANKGRGRFTEEADCWLLNLTTFFSYGNWEKIREHVALDSAWRCDWSMLSRSAGDLGRRTELLIRAMKKEEGERFSRGRRRLDMPVLARLQQPSTLTAQVKSEEAGDPECEKDAAPRQQESGLSLQSTEQKFCFAKNEQTSLVAGPGETHPGAAASLSVAQDAALKRRKI